jgi:hypothetical protein
MKSPTEVMADLLWLRFIAIEHGKTYRLVLDELSEKLTLEVDGLETLELRVYSIG